MDNSVDNRAGKLLVKHRSGDTVGRSEPAQSNHFCPVLFLPWQMAIPTKAALTALICCQHLEEKRVNGKVWGLRLL